MSATPAPEHDLAVELDFDFQFDADDLDWLLEAEPGEIQGAWTVRCNSGGSTPTYLCSNQSNFRAARCSMC